MPKNKKKPGRKARGGKKGNPFERAICKQLSLWWTGDKQDDVFWRTSTSGARATSRSKKGQRTFGQYGDVQATDPIGQPLLDIFTIELKRGYPKATASNALDPSPKMKQQQLIDFVKQAEESSITAGSRFWMVIQKRDQRETTILLPRYAVKKLPVDFKDTTHLYLCIRDAPDYYNLIQMRLNDFLDQVHPVDIKSLHRKIRQGKL